MIMLFFMASSWIGFMKEKIRVFTSSFVLSILKETVGWPLVKISTICWIS